jgi:hypothetical protein
VNDVTPQRRPVQFSLRKLMLWIAAWAVYLSLMRWAKLPQPFGLILTLWLIGILAIRLKWGYSRQSHIIAGHVTGIPTACFFAVVVLELSLRPLMEFGGWFRLSCALAIGWLLGFVVAHNAYLIADFFVNMVNLADDSLRTRRGNPRKPPPC